ncbi:hypothetical protein WHR41_04026 [Cladosporium halotolerans]|uniref:DNA replication regulator Sld3 C-terminal domain-containing protein n=1 Tax=Cladosporium halotolerans TaxID=1052096 RepID=A0AB34KPI1_9PEZI
MSLLSASPILESANRLSAKKRKRDEEAETGLPSEIDARPFAVRPTGDDPFAKTASFTPLCLLRRQQLPLAFLDSEGSGSRLFTARIPILESSHEDGDDGHVLVAEQREEGRLYAVERAAKRVYALCRLGKWVTKDTMFRLSKVNSAKPERFVKRKLDEQTGTSPWWSRAAVSLPSADSQSPSRVSGILRLSVQSQAPPPVPGTRPVKDDLQEIGDSAEGNAEPLPHNSNADAKSGENTVLDPLEELAKQYLDALYLSRTSLAYFAKGPLSRARSAFTSGTEDSPQASQLVEFLRNSILTATVMDKKYRDQVPAVVKDLPVIAPIQDDKGSKSRRKRKFKPKRDKAGLFTNEPEYLEKWWRGEEPSGSTTSPENIDTALRRRIPGLRARETYLQVIMILETIFLETTLTNTDQQPNKVSDLAIESQNIETQETETQTATEMPKRKSKKPQDLHSLLETLLDRLCIWQSLEAHTPASSRVNDGNTAEGKGQSNDLRDFCVEIIVPFFMSRLPKEAALVNKKLGGPSPPSPEKRKSTSSRSKPGEPALRSRPEKQPRKPLSRVTTETLNHTTKQMPGLHRSATDSALIKREDSQPLLSAIPAAPPQAARRPREDLLKSLSSTHRQVDLNANSAAAAEKLRKKRETEAQVREAINNARKPNRPMATKEVAARADERFAQTLAKSSRSSRTQGVHVAATPKRVKSGPTAQFVPASTHSAQPSMVPSSSSRYGVAPPLARIDGTPAIPQTSHQMTGIEQRAAGIAETPSRGSRFADVSPTAFRAAPVSLCESPSARRKSKAPVASTPLKVRKVSFGVGETPVMGNLKDKAPMKALVEGTPVKGLSERQGLFSGQEASAEEKSIYDAWNDDDYEELA